RAVRAGRGRAPRGPGRARSGRAGLRRRRPQGRRRGRAGRRDALHRRVRRTLDLALEACHRAGRGGPPVSTNGSSKDVAVAGVGMHPWGKWGKSFVTYGVHAARAALTDAGIPWTDVDLVVGGETV